MRRGFATPRRAVLSLLAAVLALVWLSNAVLSIIFRDAYPAESFHRWLPLVPLIYATWHAVKTAWRRPEDAIEWTPAEREFAAGGPFGRRELVMYRIAVVLSATLLKATCGTLLLLPDLKLAWAGFLGIFLGLAFVDMMRMAMDIIAAQVTTRTYMVLRGIVLAGAASAAGAALLMAMRLPTGELAGTGVTATMGWISRLFAGAGQICDSPIGLLLQSPFMVFTRVIAAPSVSLQLLGWMLASVTMLGALIEFVMRIDHRLNLKQASREADLYDRIENLDFGQAVSQKVDAVLPKVPQLGGAGPLMWRQFVGAREHAGGLLLALAAPAILSCLLLLENYEPKMTFAYVCAALGFYSLLLLPAGLKFDFRRDAERLGTFKMLPVRPLSVVVGELAAPVTISIAFQAIVLTAVILIRPVPVNYLFGAMLFLAPLNILIYSLENSIFLLYPHRLNQEGLEVFLRTTLMFTAKSLLFAFALVVVYMLSQIARDLAESPLLRPVTGGNHLAAFAATMWIAVTLAAVLCTGVLTRVYDRHDPCLDRIA